MRRMTKAVWRVAAASLLVLVLLPAGIVGSTNVDAATAVPRRVFSPFFETWRSDSLTNIAQQSGTRYFTLAFLETLGTDSCTLAWNGDSNRQVGAGGYAADIASLRGLGGDVIPSFGGWSADQGGTEIGDSCKDVNAIAAAYEGVITTYDVSRLDMDIEGASLGRSNGIDRRNKAIKIVQDWAIAQGRPLTVSYTLPTVRTGLLPDAYAVLHNAVANGVRIDVVQPMVFDYYDGKRLDMGTSAITALKGLHHQLKALLPGKSGPQRWAMEGATLMIGRDDNPAKTETTHLQDARQVRRFAKLKGMAVLSFWAVQRDNGGCPGTTGAGTCSGINQPAWAFSSILNTFTR